MTGKQAEDLSASDTEQQIHCNKFNTAMSYPPEQITFSGGSLGWTISPPRVLH